ncbi:MAG TPA: LOG family protein [Casimicrobiaceae bacterium]|nr:LOG family protein [Casimicrobiaceae bacterium]
MAARDNRSARSPKRTLPQPAKADRRSPLPWHRPKSVDDDVEAPERVRALLESPSYRLADEDIAFLQQPEMRGVRLQLDFWKAEDLLAAHGVEHTIVVFGSTRIPEPAEALRRLEDARRSLAALPEDTDRKRSVKIAERVCAQSHYYDVARAFGRIVGESSAGDHALRLVIMTGGGPGIMEAANRGAFDVRAKTVGLNVALPNPQFPNPYITPELCFRFHYFAMRKLHFMQRARALVVFPGGYGTMDELFEVLALVQTRKIAPVPVVLVGERYWRRAVDFDFLTDEGTIDPEDVELFWFAETAEEIWASISEWYASKGDPLPTQTTKGGP